MYVFQFLRGCTLYLFLWKHQIFYFIFFSKSQNYLSICEVKRKMTTKRTACTLEKKESVKKCFWFRCKWILSKYHYPNNSRRWNSKFIVRYNEVRIWNPNQSADQRSDFEFHVKFARSNIQITSIFFGLDDTYSTVSTDAMTTIHVLLLLLSLSLPRSFSCLLSYLCHSNI